MVNEVIPYNNAPQKKKSLLSGILGFLLCLKTQNSQPAYQEIQSVHHVLPNEKILRQMIDLFITHTERPPNPVNGNIFSPEKWRQFLAEEAASYSEAMTGAPVCALVKTTKDAWLVGLTRTVKLRWPEFCFEANPKLYERHNLDDYATFLKKQLQTREYEILRDTEKWQAVIAPIRDKKVNLKLGYLFKWKGNPEHNFQTPLSKKAPMASARLFTLDVPNLLRNMQNFHTVIETDEQKRKKYLSSEMYSRPEDYEHIRGWGHMSSIKFVGNYPVLRGRYFWDPGLVAKGVDDNFEGLYPVGEISFKGGQKRFTISPPENGARLIYKAEEKFYHPLQKTPELE